MFTPLVILVAVAVPPKLTSHTTRDILGWTVHIDDRLSDDLGKIAIRCLESQLHNISLILPADKVTRLRKVPIWLDRTHGKLVPAQYHPGAEWLAENGYDRALVKCVHVPDATYFAGARHQREQPWAILHELAHAYHDQVLGFDHGEVKVAWQAFRDSDRSKQVLHVNGKLRDHYARTNPMEFFAEMTEAYFGSNDFFPFNSGELKRDERAIFSLMERTWGKLP